MAFNYIIGTQNFERIRDIIGVIIAAEFAGQYTLTSNPLFQSDIWVERFVPFDVSELPAINITIDSIQEKQSNPGRTVYTANFQIQIFTLAEETDSQRGDIQSVLNNHKLTGAIRYILKNTTYVRLKLDSSPLTIQNFQMPEIVFVKPDLQDGNNIMVSQITLAVQYDEDNGSITPVNLQQVISQFKLDETEKGYKISLIND